MYSDFVIWPWGLSSEESWFKYSWLRRQRVLYEAILHKYWNSQGLSDVFLISATKWNAKTKDRAFQCFFSSQLQTIVIIDYNYYAML